MSINFPGSEESRAKSMKDTEKKILQGQADIERLGKELRYTQEVVVGELQAGRRGVRNGERGDQTVG